MTVKTWLSPSRVAAIGTVVVALLLISPIQIRKPGDHEDGSCGNALMMDLSQWRNATDGDYYEGGYRACVAGRVNRIAWAVAVMSVTVLIVTAQATRTRRRTPSDQG